MGFGFLGMEALPLLVVTGCFYGVLVSGDSAIYSTAITELAEPDRLGSAQAFQAFLGFGATILAPVAASLLLDLGLGWGVAFAMAGVVGLVLALPLVSITRQERRAGSRHL